MAKNRNNSEILDAIENGVSLSTLHDDDYSMDEYVNELGQGLDEAQLAALDALLDGKTQKEAAKAACRSEKWLWQQMNTSGNFKGALNAARNGLETVICLKALHRAEAALDAMRDMINDPDCKDRLKACMAMLAIANGE